MGDRFAFLDILEEQRHVRAVCQPLVVAASYKLVETPSSIPYGDPLLARRDSFDPPLQPVRSRPELRDFLAQLRRSVLGRGGRTVHDGQVFAHTRNGSRNLA